MKKHLSKISVFLIALLLIFGMAACANGGNTGNSTRAVIGIEVDSTTIPTDAVAGSVDLSAIKVNVYWNDDTVTPIDLTLEMISINDRAKLSKVGQQQITVVYEKCTTKFQINFGAAAKRQYELTVEGGEIVAVNGVTLTPDQRPEIVNGKIVMQYEEGTDVEISWISVDGYNFSHWTDFGNARQTTPIASVLMNENHYYRAVTSTIVNTVYFYTNGASVATLSPKRTNLLNEIDINSGKTLEREGYVFDGWTTTPVDGENAINSSHPRVTFPYRVEVETSLYATWRPLGIVCNPKEGHDGYIITRYELSYLTDMLKAPTSLVIPTKYQGYRITGIAADAFNTDEAAMLQTIYIPETITYIEDGAFRNCTQLTSISVSVDSPSFTTEDGVLYNISKEKLIAYPAAKIARNFDVPGTVTQIAPYTFKDALLGSIVLDSAITAIGESAFDSPHIDRIDFSALTVNGGTVFGQDMFNENLRKILVSPSYLGLYQNSVYFASVLDKITIDLAEFSNVELGIYPDKSLLYRMVINENSPSPQLSVEIIGAKRDLVSLNFPPRINGRYVFSVAPRAFNHCVYLSDIVFSKFDSSLERVGEDAFGDTPWLAAVKQNDSLIINDILYKYLGTSSTFVLPASIVKIAEGAFYGNTILRTIDMSQNNKLTTIAAYAFYNCANLSGNLTLMANVESVYNYAFANTAIENVILHENSNLKTVGGYAFANCHYLKGVQLGSKTSSIATTAFLYDYSLEAFSIQAGAPTPYFLVYDGVLYKCGSNGVANELFAYPAGKLSAVFNVAEPVIGTRLNISTIGDYALFFANIAALVIPDTITAISANAAYIPGLIYVEFERPLSNITYKLLFVDDPLAIGKYEPQYVVFNITDDVIDIPTEAENNDINNFYGQNSELRNLKTVYNRNHTKLYRDGNLLYAFDTLTAVLSVAKSSRTAQQITIPSSYSVEGSALFVKYIDAYAFFGYYLNKVVTGTDILHIADYAFYGAVNLAVLDMKENTQVPVIYKNTFNSRFNNGLLIYILAGTTDNYISRWSDNTEINVTYKYLLESGEGIANYVTLSNEEWNSIRYYDGAAWKTVTSDTHTERYMVMSGYHPVPQRKGYIFMGWYDEAGRLIDANANYLIPYNINLTARWEPEVYTIIFKVGNGVTMPTTEITIKYDDAFEFDIPTYPNKRFLYWRDSTGKTYGSSTDETYRIWKTYLNSDTLVLYPVWEDVEYIIVYDSASLEGATYDATAVSVKYATYFALTVPEKTGYIFLGWSLTRITEGQTPVLITDENGISLDFWSLNDAEQYTVYPYFIAKSEITVTLMIAGGIQYDIVTDVVFGQSFSFPYLAEKISDGSVLTEYPVALFCGWVDSMGIRYTDDSGRGLYTWNVPTDTTLYALWPRQIDSQEEFDEWLGEEDYLSQSIALNCDVTLTDPIGDRNNPYIGVFIGNGYTVTLNYTVAGVDSGNYDGYVGMVAYNKGTIKNVRLDAVINIATTSGYNNDLFLGGMAGINEGRIISTESGSSADIRVSILVNFTLSAKFAYIGGIAGRSSGEISNISCELNTITIKVSGQDYTGASSNIIAGSIVGNVTNGSVSTRSAKYYYLDGAYVLGDFGAVSSGAQTAVNVAKTKIS